MSKWAFIARARDLEGDGPHHVSAGGTDAVVVRVGGELRAFEGLCPHQGALLGEGELVDGQLVCRNHGWCFDTSTGARVGGEQCLARFALREVEGRVEIDLADTETPEAKSATRTRADLPGPRALPLVGNALQLPKMESFHRQFEIWAETYGPVYRISLGKVPYIVAADPGIIAAVLRRRPDTFTRFFGLKPIFDELGVGGVFSEEGEDWRPQRQLAMGALNPRRLRPFFGTLTAVTERLRKRWKAAAEAGEVVDLQSEMMRFTVDVTTNLAFSEETNSVDGESSMLLDNLDPMFPLIARRLNAIVPYWRLFKLPSDHAAERSLAEVRSWLEDVIGRTRLALAEDPERAAHPTNFLEAMIMARDAKGKPFSDQVIFGNAVQMLLAGEDTTANTLAWAVHLLLDAPDEVEKLRAAVAEELEDDLHPASFEAASAMKAVDHVANETLRLKPVAPLMFFTATKDTVIEDLAVDAGTTIAMLTRLPGLDPKMVRDPLEFQPERWRDPKVLSTMQRSGAFVPFGSGPRICPGRSLAMLEIRIVLSMLYRNFEVERVGKSDEVEEVYGFTVAPRGLQVRFHSL